MVVPKRAAAGRRLAVQLHARRAAAHLQTRRALDVDLAPQGLRCAPRGVGARFGPSLRP